VGNDDAIIEQYLLLTKNYRKQSLPCLKYKIFDRASGVIDKEVALHWQKYDLHHYAKPNWSTDVLRKDETKAM